MATSIGSSAGPPGSTAFRAAEHVDSTLRVYAPRPAGVLAAIVLAASDQGLMVRDATSTPPSLETVFLALTGREYRE
jgi:ABC-2 type transport system ATP-binding protein